MARTKYNAGNNIAMKVPPDQFESTVKFYRDLLGLEVDQDRDESVVFKFGHVYLWIDRAPTLSQSEIWLEIVTDDTESAREMMAQNAIVRCDEIEALPEDLDGFWIKSPADIVHLVANE
jgi:catechol 2,3-dioxygenase-like lactoylglutathione lyase family enzyme